MYDRRNTAFQMIALALMFVAAFAFAAPAATIVASGENRGIYDNNHDDLGNAQQTPAGSLAIGERNTPSQPTNDELRYWLPFELTLADRAAIASASQVWLNLNLVQIQNMSGYAIDIWNVTGRTSATAVNSDYQAGSLLVNDAITTSTPTGIVSWDVTSFVKSEAAVAGSVIAFILRVDPINLPNGDGTINNYIVSTVGAAAGLEPTLTTVPEPASFALLGLGAVLMFRRRRMLRHAPVIAGLGLVMMIGMVDSARAATIIDAASAGRTIDNNADEIGNSGFSAEAVAVGEPGNSNENDEGRYIVYFTPNAAQRAAIATAGQITLDVNMQRTGDSSANLAGFAVDLYGFEDVAFGGITAGQYHQAATLLEADAFTAADGGLTNVLRSFDVTSFAKTEAARSATSTIAFRFQVDPATLPIANGKQVFWVIDGIDLNNGGVVPVEPTLTLTTVPEPATSALLGLGAMALIRRRR